MMNLFYELIRFALGTQDRLSRIPTSKEWQKLYDLATSQSIVGICYAGIQKLNRDQQPERALLLTWKGVAARIQKRNEEMDEYTSEGLRFFREKGFPCQILKGQGVAKLYGNLSVLRNSGDIDLWVAGRKEKLFQLSRDTIGKIKGWNNFHILFPGIYDGDVEAHLRPARLYNPFKDRLFHKFCLQHIPQDGCADSPSLEFNRVYILLHCFNHFCGRGVGLRQIMDYYFVLKSSFEADPSQSYKQDTMMWIKKLGLLRFASAMMWVFQEVFGMDERFLLCEPNEKEGKYLKREIMLTGNMGKYDSRFSWSEYTTPLKRFVNNQKKNIKLLSHYPEEVFWNPIYNIFRYFYTRIK
ncbi:MAG: nucleotidyltransferase family protein [Prevotellaceae bacterium]|nr:nucleotidyltransferase family protein [Candidatus Faecinaster equi]